MKPVALTPEQQKIAADHVHLCRITAGRYAHLAPLDDLESACWLRLCRSVLDFDPGHVSGAAFKTYLIRNLRWECSRVVNEAKRHRAASLDIDIPVEDVYAMESIDLDDLIDGVTPGRDERRHLRQILRYGSTYHASVQSRGATRCQLDAIYHRFINRASAHLGVTP